MKTGRLFFRIMVTAILSVFCAVLLSGCRSEISREDPSDGDLLELEKASGKLMISDLPEEDLKKPDRVIKSLEDYIYALDYLAFYRIGDKVFFEIDSTYAEEIFNPYTIHQKAYQMADLADVYACQMDDSFYSETHLVGIKYSMSKDIASEAPESQPDVPILSSFDRSVPVKSSGEIVWRGQKIHCENSEQLYYLVMNGYHPVPKEGSDAERILKEAESVFSNIISGDMTDFQKVKSVYDWLTTEVRYDRETAYSAETYLVKEQAYYLEGVFLNHCAVCDGKAKACALLLNMAGIPCVRTTGVNEGGDHAWNMVRVDGKWYILCSTYGQADLTAELGRIVPNYSMLLSGKETAYEWYPAQKHQEIEAQLESQPYDYYDQMGKDDKVSLKIRDLKELEQLLNMAEESAKGNGHSEYKVEFMYAGDDTDRFVSEMKAYLEGKGNYNAAEVRCEYGTAYEIMVLE